MCDSWYDKFMIFESNVPESIGRTKETLEKASALRSKRMEIVKKDPIHATEKLGKFALHLISKYNDCLDYEAYHILVGSTPMKECLKFDFEGEDSVVSFIDSMSRN